VFLNLLGARTVLRFAPPRQLNRWIAKGLIRERGEKSMNGSSGLTPKELIESALLLKERLMAQYDDIIWKIRSGYIVILYGALTLLVGKNGVPDFAKIATNSDHSFSLFSLIVGLSLSVFLIDFGYVRKRMKIVAVRDLLVEIALNEAYRQEETAKDYETEKLLKMAGETPVKKLPKQARQEYIERRNWNLIWILLPIYFTTPIIALIVYLKYLF
jgi:hypothetical protein